MDTICLEFTTAIINPSFDVLVDDCVAKTSVSDNLVTITCDLQYGFHLLEITLANVDKSIPVVFTSASLNGVNFRQTLYTMFVNKQDKHQTTTLTDRDSVLYLPFINPISAWIASCAEKIPAKLYAHNLYEELKVYYPESIKISDKFPKIMQDFMSYNADFYVHAKSLLADPYYKPTVPYTSITNLKYNDTALSIEMLANLEFLKNNARVPAQSKYNKLETNKSKWKAFDFIIEEKIHALLTEVQFPELYKLIHNLNIDKILHGFISILGPGDYITPHIDQYDGMEFMKQYVGCSQIYIPINFKLGNYFKFTNIGLVPLEQAPLLINNHNFSHALINDSNEYRFALAIVGSPLNVAK